MPTRYKVEAGDCISSLAFDNGLLPDTIWNHPDNAHLRCRQRNILLPGDEVVIPDVELKEVSGATDKRHCFVRKQVREILRVVVHDAMDKPLANMKYTLTIDGSPSSGETSTEGLVQVPIPANARTGKLVVGHQSLGDDTYE